MLPFFTTTGRLRRRAYFGRVLVLYLVAAAFYGLPALAELQFGDTAPHWQSLALGGILLCYYLVFAQAVKRLHDLDLRGWWLLLFLLPIVGLGLGSGMQFVSGTNGPNRFGADSKQSSHTLPGIA